MLEVLGALVGGGHEEVVVDYVVVGGDLNEVVHGRFVDVDVEWMREGCYLNGWS